MNLPIGAPACVILALAMPASAGDAFVRTELAGHPLAAYPHFQYTRSINEDRAVSLAVDPGRFPAIVGITADLYVVQAKTPAQWGEDPSLVDVRTSGAQVVTLGGATIQENTFTLAAPHELDSSAGIGMGAAYDFVIDANRSGTLDTGDYVDDGGAGEAGAYIVHDITQSGPLPVTFVDYSGGTFLDQRTYYPTDIASLGAIPLVVISHGWTYQYTYYDYLQRHLASYGYVVMSHSNDVGDGLADGTLSASLTTITNTDHLLSNLDTIAGGALDGHVDGSRIIWFGHSTGAEGVVMAATRLRNGAVVPASYGIDDLSLIVPIAPVSFWPIESVDPGDLDLHMFIGGADTDTSGAPLSSYTQPISIFERGTGNRHLTYIHGAGHGNFLDEGAASPLASGPDLIGWAGTHPVVLGYALVLAERYTKGNPAAKDYLTRMYDDLHPIGIDGAVVVATEYRDAETSAKFVIDDYQVPFAGPVSTSGGTTTYDVSNHQEVLMKDRDGSFQWTGTQASNGMTRARFDDDDPRCVLFDWTPDDPGFYEQEIIPLQRDLADDAFLSFRVCQGTRHPETVVLDAPLTLTVTLRDMCGASSSIHTGNYGGVTTPYKRTGFGPGAGWQNEFSTIRLRLSDFAGNGRGLDLHHVEAVRFEFGPGFGSERGRIGLDDIEIIGPDLEIPGLPSPCCITDTNGDGATDIDDIVNVVLDFGTDGRGHGGDVDGSGTVDIDDIVMVVLRFGTTCE